MKLFFELVQVAIGRRCILSQVPSAEEWNLLFKLAQKQALVGVCFHALLQLERQEMMGCLPRQLKLRWFALAVSCGR